MLEHWCGKTLYISIAIAVCVAAGQALYFLLAPCKSKVDMIFMLDTSQSVKEADLQNMKQFVNTIVNHENVKDNGQSTIAQFSHMSEFILQNDSRYISDTEKISSNLNQFKQLQTFTDTWGALKFIDNSMINAEFKRNASNVLFFLTDGTSEVPNMSQYMVENQEGNLNCLQEKIIDLKNRTKCPRTAQPIEFIKKSAQSIKSQGVDIYAIGVGQFNDTELMAIAGDESKIIRVDNFEELDGVAGVLVENLCTIHWWLLSIPVAIFVLGILIQLLLSFIEVRKLAEDEAELAEALNAGTNLNGIQSTKLR